MPPVLSPYVRHADDNPIKPPWQVRPRHIWDYELLFVKEGTLRVTVEDCEYEGRPGDIFLFKPRQLHSIILLGEQTLRQPHVHFDLVEQPDSPDVRISFRPETAMSDAEKQAFRPDLLSGGPLALPNLIRLAYPTVFEQMLYELIHEFGMKLPLYEINCKAIVLRMIAYLVRELQWSRTPHVGSHRQTLHDIQRYLYVSDRDVSLDELSDKFRLSKFYVNRLFSTAFGIGPIRYHQTMRIQKAKQLLQATGMTVQEIADRLGFPNIHTFSRAFKNKEGVSPLHYRRGGQPGT